MKSIDGHTRVVGVTGWPVEHTLSPAMHNAAIGQLGINWVYIALPVAPERFEEAILGAQALGMAGLNVTIPHKQAAAALAGRPDRLVRAIGAANTLHFKDDAIHAYNTDAPGYTETVEEESDFRFAGQTILQIGSGGVGRAMAAGAAEAGAARVMLFDVRADQTAALVQDLTPHYPHTQFDVLADAEILAEAAARAGLIANATPLGMKPGDPLPLPAEALRPGQTVFDAVYVPALTPLLREAAARGAIPVRGLGMLARQGARALAIWTGLQPDQALMIRVLKEKLGQD